MKSLLNIFVFLLLLSACQGSETTQETQSLLNKSKEDEGEIMFTIENYKNTIKNNLQSNSDKLITKLTEIHNLNFDPQVELLDFSTSIEPTRYELSIVMYSMDKEGNEVFNEDSDSKFADSMDVLESIVIYHEPTGQADKFLEFYEKSEEELVMAEQEMLKDWFVDCWEKASGPQFRLTSYLSFHDEYRSYDLKKGKWISEDEMWSY
ncbi:hypothetical protein [Bacillus sp. V5-8f]|uniref:hypothetical protein n=1 Tax=Bacillus sp. V5-8f TaxID=2053044 RepID=UPI000C7658CF|nr:hypothetical protein [Bacillus sp. V5-8f]PLT35667.1 hypothetical protein CUU64_03450 [Bacillus sp. V5-8f]